MSKSDPFISPLSVQHSASPKRPPWELLIITFSLKSPTTCRHVIMVIFRHHHIVHCVVFPCVISKDCIFDPL
ncbi:hypothetical protein ACSQ67_000966 [Phaseolus vulgaris]